MTSTQSPGRLRGTITALVTPMTAEGKIDWPSLDALVDWQLESGIDGLLPCGTTGEASTLTIKEQVEVVSRVVQRVDGKVPVIGGAGSNSTHEAIELQKAIEGTGADYALVATPYYNKPTDEGLRRHYRAVTEAAGIPTIMYNVPSRTGCDLKPELAVEIAQWDKIVGLKEATGELGRVGAIKGSCPADFSLLSGDDFTAAPSMWLGGDGVISVTSNVAPAEMSDMGRQALAGNISASKETHHRLSPLFDALFVESNPIPVKAGLALMNRISESYRLPLCPPNEQTRENLRNVLSELDLI